MDANLFCPSCRNIAVSLVSTDLIAPEQDVIREKPIANRRGIGTLKTEYPPEVAHTCVKTTSDTHRDPQRGRHHQDRVDDRCVYGTFLLTFSARLDPFRIA